MAAPVNLTAAQVRAIAQATSGLLNAQQQQGVIAALDAVVPAAAATARGTVLKVASQAAAAGATPTKAEYDALLTALRTAGVMV